VLARILFLLIAIPLIDLVLLLLLAEATNWLFTILLILATGIVGAYLARYQGLAAIRRIRSDLAHGQMPAAAVLDAALILLAAIFLLAPGVVTDIVGISLLIPSARRRYGEWIAEWSRSRLRKARTGAPAGRHSVVIDSYVIEGTSRAEPKASSVERPSSGP